MVPIPNPLKDPYQAAKRGTQARGEPDFCKVGRKDQNETFAFDEGGEAGNTEGH